MSRPITPRPASRPGSVYAEDIPGVANLDHAHGALDDRDGVGRSHSLMSQSETYIPSRSGTLKKKASVKRGASLKRSGSRKSSYAGSVRSLRVGEKDRYDPEEYSSAFYCPVPTVGSPTELLANRFQAWRKVLKDLINYFRDLHKAGETRSKILLSASNVINNTGMPPDFITSGGLGDAFNILREHHKQALTEAQKARDLENDVVMQLTGLRSDLAQKIKEIKSLSGDFKNSVAKEQDQTRKTVNGFQEALGLMDHDASATAGKGDPFIMKLGVERQLERQIEEENYLHRAYLNLEASGRELESIVVGEIQKAYTVLAGILKRDADSSYDAAEKLREGPLAMAKDYEWDHFVTDNENMVDPRQSLRQVEQITYPGKNHPAALDVKSGMLERKSKYLKNYTPGWYVLSPTHMHEFKSADRIAFQQPVMSLFLHEQKLGSHSDAGSSSHKFMLKGRQTGSMHRGHTWIFRAETHDTMMAWYSDIKELTEKRGEARNEFVRRTHARSLSAGSMTAPSVSSGDSQMGEDEADKTAFAGEQSVRGYNLEDADHSSNYAPEALVAGAAAGTTAAVVEDGRSEAGWRPPQRPQPGGRFPSDVNVTRGLQAPLSPSSGDSDDELDRSVIGQANTLPGSVPFTPAATTMAAASQMPAQQSKNDSAGAASVPSSQRDNEPQPISTSYTSGEHARVNAQPTGAEVANDTQSTYKEWMGAMGVGAGGAALGAGAANVYGRRQQDAEAETALRPSEELAVRNAMVTDDGTSAPIPILTSAHVKSHAPVQPTEDFPAYTGSVVANGGPIGETDVRAPSTSAAAIETPRAATGSGLHYSVTDAAPAAAQTAQPSLSTKASDSTLATTIADTEVASSATIPVRPAPISSQSVQTISDLHIPGEFPRPARS